MGEREDQCRSHMVGEFTGEEAEDIYQVSDGEDKEECEVGGLFMLF